MQAIVPSFDVIVSSYSQLENAPARGRPGVAVDPGFRDVLGKLLQLVCCCLSSQLLEHWPDFSFGQERQGHELTHILVWAVVMIVLVLESKLLNLKTKKAKKTKTNKQTKKPQQFIAFD